MPDRPRLSSVERKDTRKLSFEAREERRRPVVGLRRRGWTYQPTPKTFASLGSPLKGQETLGAALRFLEKVHHAKVVKAWLADHADEIEVFDLSSCSPELNPDEMLNADLKAVVTRKAPARAKGDLKRVAISHLRRLQKSPKRVMRYFQHKPVRYAA